MNPPSPTQVLRTFVAINLTDPLKTAIGTRQRELESMPGGQAVRWIPRAQLHLTLRFLGDVSPPALPDLQEALARAAASAQPFNLRVEGAGCFPHPRQPRIVWLGVAGATEALRILAEAVHRETSQWGKTDDRPFHPHLTIGRIKMEHARAARPLAEGLPAMGAPLPDPWPVTALDLMASRLTPAGAAYSVLASISLRGGSPEA